MSSAPSSPTDHRAAVSVEVPNSPSPRSPTPSSANIAQRVAPQSPSSPVRSSRSSSLSQPHPHALELSPDKQISRLAFFFFGLFARTEIPQQRAILKEAMHDEYYKTKIKNQIAPFFADRIKTDEKKIESAFHALKSARNAYAQALHRNATTPLMEAEKYRLAFEYHFNRKEFELIYQKWADKCNKRYGILLAREIRVTDNWEVDEKLFSPALSIKNKLIDTLYTRYKEALWRKFGTEEEDKTKRQLVEELFSQDDYAVTRVLEKAGSTSYLDDCNAKMYEIFERNLNKKYPLAERKNRLFPENPEILSLYEVHLFAQSNSCFNQMLFVCHKVTLLLQNVLNIPQEDLVTDFNRLELETPPAGKLERVPSRGNVPRLQLADQHLEKQIARLLTPRESPSVYVLAQITGIYNREMLPSIGLPETNSGPSSVNDASLLAILNTAREYRKALEECEKALMLCNNIQFHMSASSEQYSGTEMVNKLKELLKYLHLQLTFLKTNLHFLGK